MKLPFELQSDEQVLVRLRRHPVHLIWHLAGLVLAGVLPIAAVLVAAGLTFGLGRTAGLIVIGLAVVWGVYWAIRGYFTWYRYENDIWVVTDQRLIDSLKNHWFHHRMASADLVDVEDIAVVREGFLQTIFKFGDLRCQTAGEQPNFVLAGIPDPVGVLGTIDRARDEARHALRGGVQG